jgi:DNA repair protein RadC
MTHSSYVVDGNGNYTFKGSISPEEVIVVALSILERQFCRGKALTSPDVTKQYLSLHLGRLEQEIFSCLFLDNGHRIISFDHMFTGTIDGAAVYPREIVKQALGHNAAAVILVHNHPSGIAEPSDADRNITGRIKDSLSLVDIRVLDHLVVGGAQIMSFAERGLL